MLVSPSWFWAWLHLIVLCHDADPPQCCKSSFLQRAAHPCSHLNFLFSEFWLALLLTSDCFLTKLKSAEFAMAGVNPINAGAVGSVLLQIRHPTFSSDSAPALLWAWQKNVGETGQALRSGHKNWGNHFNGSWAEQAVPYLLFLQRCSCS